MSCFYSWWFLIFFYFATPFLPFVGSLSILPASPPGLFSRRTSAVRQPLLSHVLPFISLSTTVQLSTWKRLVLNNHHSVLLLESVRQGFRYTEDERFLLCAVWSLGGEGLHSLGLESFGSLCLMPGLG